MSPYELKGFICSDNAGKQYTVIEYRPPAPQTTPNHPNHLNATASIRFFKTATGLEVIQISATTFKIVNTPTNLLRAKPQFRQLATSITDTGACKLYSSR